MTPLIQTTAPISPGSSGGGLFDREGRLVGLTPFYVEGGQSLNFAMPVEWIGEVKPGRKMAGEGHSQTEWLKRAIALEKREDWQGLLDWCRKWTKIEPKNALAWYSLWEAYYELKRYNDSIEALRQAVRVDPENASTWNNLGINYDHLKPYNDAIEAYRQAVRINSEFSVAWNNLGNAYGRLERYNDSIEALRQAVRIDPEDASAWYNLGVSYDHSGNKTAALDAVRELRRLDPTLADKLFNRVMPR